MLLLSGSPPGFTIHHFTCPPTTPVDGLEITRILVAGDLERARAFYRDVLGAELVREYGGTSVVARS